MADGRLPEVLRERVERDMAPVRPLAPPWRRAAVLLPWAAMLLLAVPVVWGLRGDRDIVGLWRLWGVSMLQIALALVVLAAVGFYFPRVLAWPTAFLSVWAAVTLVARYAASKRRAATRGAGQSAPLPAPKSAES